MIMHPFVANALWWLSCASSASHFRVAMNKVEDAQRATLARIIRSAKDTVYGRKYGFDNILCAEDYRSRVPLTNYEDYLPYIHRICKGERNVLSNSMLLCMEPTSGSSSASKLIPYTLALRNEYQAGIAPWVYDMFRRNPALLNGRAYWSISPATVQEGDASGAVPVGFEDDTAYVNPTAQWLIQSALAVPSEVAKIQDMDTFRYVTLAYLLSARDLSLISVWNPTFLSLMLSAFDKWAPQLIRDIHDGTLSPVVGEASIDSLERFVPHFRANPKRTKEIEAILSCQVNGRIRYDHIWPNLRLISCWTSAYASGPARELQTMFPTVRLVSKGLLATEGIVSIPYGKQDQHVLAVLSHFFEFIPKGQDTVCLPAWQLEENQHYSVVMTTSGGFYRYRLRDIIKVTGYLQECPIIEFVGKESIVSDHFGEKLNEHHIATTLKNLGVNYSFMLLAPDGDDLVDHYTLFLAENTTRPPRSQLVSLQYNLEQALQKNIHYAYCRRLGQLREVDICWIDCSLQTIQTRYFQQYQNAGQKAGNIKSRVLDSNTGWRKILCDEQ